MNGSSRTSINSKYSHQEITPLYLLRINRRRTLAFENCLDDTWAQQSVVALGPLAVGSQARKLHVGMSRTGTYRTAAMIRKKVTWKHARPPTHMHGNPLAAAI
jgi:hypothetical protein